MNRKELLGPDTGLAKEQIVELNKEFYDEYFEEYFEIRLLLLGEIITNPELFSDFIKKQKIKVGVLEINPESTILNKELLLKYAKLEMSVTYYHCLETFLRVFLAHIEIKQSPWLEISRETNYKIFKESLVTLSEGKFNFAYQGLSSDELITYVFCGHKQLPDDVNNREEVLNAWKEWIKWAAKETIKMYDYNAYKHGLAIQSDTRGFSLGNEKDGQIKVDNDSLKFLSKKRKKDRWIWEKRVVFTPLDYRGACISIIESLIKNILTVGKLTYLGIEFESLEFLPNETCTPQYFMELSNKDKNEFGLVAMGYSMELLYYKQKSKN
ncbi:hypothetical protein [Paenibacillus typhae]|uniref:Uncharacterized protein n=1 Tax=Paenibacillus typhae TaxID=1174501 RepID=A0A1G8X145_9BACL|nr:hypothetical protein [Paenibacillus typhae]SDJ84368.1 hypothetical protein SAMN05216192_12560 [Paenibacillus typhae]